MIQSNLLKRFLTSIILLLVMFFSIKVQFVLYFMLLIFSFFSAIEFFDIIDKIKNLKFIKTKKTTFFYKGFFLIYLIFLDILIYKSLNLSTPHLINFVFILSICVATDIGGLIFGKIFGGKKLTKLSPNKTYAGSFGGLILSILVFFAFNIYYSLTVNYQLLIITIIISIISQLGDLFFSYLKRKAKIKHTGTLLPGHGGILDRVDGILFGLPFGIIFLSLLNNL